VAGAPAIVFALGVGRSLQIFLVSLTLAYFFICEALWGQTIGKRVLGLRVLMHDGRPATASAVSARTVFRLIDDGPIGLVVMLLTGKRRQRIGDLVGGTIVARAVPGVPHAALSPMLLVYPVAWSIGAIALALSTQPHDNYLAAVDQVCQQRRDTFAAAKPGEVTVARMVSWVHADHRAIGALKAPSGAQDLRREILAIDAGMVDAIDQAVARAEAQPDPASAFSREVAGIQAREQEVDARYAELGLKTCAGRTT
jgi:RDD family